METLPLKLLVADDNVDIRDSLQILLWASGHEVYVCSDGEEALTCIRRHQPDVAILDIGMPKQTGLDVVRFIRSGPAPHPIFIGISGYGSDRDVATAKATGFDFYLIKPPDLNVLAAILAQVEKA